MKSSYQVSSDDNPLKTSQIVNEPSTKISIKPQQTLNKSSLKSHQTIYKYLTNPKLALSEPSTILIQPPTNHCIH